MDGFVDNKFDRRDDEKRSDQEDAFQHWDERLITANEKESFDIHRGDDRYTFRALSKKDDVLFAEYVADRRTARERQLSDAEMARRHAEEEHSQRMRFAEQLHALTMSQLSNQLQVTNSQQVNMNQVTNGQQVNGMEVMHKDDLQSTAHRDLAIAQEWRDQARDSGESAFAPKQSE